MSVSLDFQKRISQLVDDSDYNRTDLRALIGLSSTAFTNAVVYGILPTPKTLLKIANFFEVSLNYLLGKCETNDYSPASNKTSFHKRFTQLCKEKSVTHYKVALDCGFADSLIVRWYGKNYLPSLDTLELLCDYFKVTPDYLLGRSDFKD